MVCIEIERKFLVRELPADIKSYDRLDIRQGYLSYDPEVRLRRADDEYFFTVKTSEMLKRGEYEVEISKQVYTDLYSKIIGRCIHKERYTIPLDHPYVAELDIYNDLERVKHTVEVEFDNIEDCNSFEPPSWFGEEVTNCSEYKNKNLARL